MLIEHVTRGKYAMVLSGTPHPKIEISRIGNSTSSLGGLLAIATHCFFLRVDGVAIQRNKGTKEQPPPAAAKGSKEQPPPTKGPKEQPPTAARNLDLESTSNEF